MKVLCFIFKDKFIAILCSILLVKTEKNPGSIAFRGLTIWTWTHTSHIYTLNLIVRKNCQLGWEKMPSLKANSLPNVAQAMY